MKNLVKKVFAAVGLLEWAQKVHADMISNKAYKRFEKSGGSGDYWERRYAGGGNSGAGSYNRLAQFKADTINGFMDEMGDIESCIEWGCGDGNQLSLIHYKNYAGVDVSRTIIEIDREKFKGDRTKQFYESDEYLRTFKDKKYDMSLSLDVIFHLVEDDVFEKYMTNLFESSKSYVCIYSNNYESQYSFSGDHVKDRIFTDWIDKNMPGWKLIKFVKQKYPRNLEITDINTSACDFYFYGKQESV